MFEDKIIPLPDDVFRLLRDFVHNYCGIYFDDGSKFLLERRLARRLEQHQLKSFEEYYHFLRYDRKREEELVILIDNLTTNETYFFRESAQLKAFSEEILPELRENLCVRRKALRIWSAGCSTGEEPYTIAILLLESGDWWRDWQIEILGSDINQRVLHTARKGVYKKSAHRATSPDMLARYFAVDEKGDYRVVDRVKELVSFSCLNLLDPYKTSLISHMDIIFCRNVIIYFDREAKKKVIGSFYQKLRDGGYLLLGHSESLINISNAFILRTLKNDMVYQKPYREGREMGGS